MGILKSELNLARSFIVLLWRQLSHQSCFALGLSFPINLKYQEEEMQTCKVVTGCDALYWFADSKMLIAVSSLVLWWTVAWCKKWVIIWTLTWNKFSPFIFCAVSIRFCFHFSSWVLPLTSMGAGLDRSLIKMQSCSYLLHGMNPHRENLSAFLFMCSILRLSFTQFIQ